jgi:predicted DNA-binding protein with PD1-like motif
VAIQCEVRSQREGDKARSVPRGDGPRRLAASLSRRFRLSWPLSRHATMSAPVVESRRALHPGKPRPDRIATAVGERPRRALAWLPEGQTLHDALVFVYMRFGARAGALYLLGGRLSSASYHVAVPRANSARVIEYGPPIRLEGCATIVRANGSYGADLSGRPLLHVHGVLSDREGRVYGGHIAPDLCVIGPGGVRAAVLLSVGFRQIADGETCFSLFFPFAEQ